MFTPRLRRRRRTLDTYVRAELAKRSGQQKPVARAGAG
jgi:hypothetical protein